MTSIYGDKIESLLVSIETLLAQKLGFGSTFQPDPTEPAQRFGICDYQSWDSSDNEFAPEESIKFTIWIVSSYESLRSLRQGQIELTANLRSILPSIPHHINQQGILLKLNYPTTVPTTKRAPMTPPNAQNKHLWIADTVVSMTMQVVIAKSMCGEHR